MTRKNTPTPIIRNHQFNIGYICSRLQCELGLSEKAAIRWIAPDMSRMEFTYGDLEQQSNRFANMLLEQGIKAGDTIFIFLPKCPELFFAFLGILKIQAVACILFPNFGEEALLDRMSNGDARCILTRKGSLKKIEAIQSKLPNLKTIILTDIPENSSPSILSYPALMNNAGDKMDIPVTPCGTPSTLHYTSGSTGKPKGVLHVHGGVLSHYQTGREILQLDGNDIYWCTADQAWVTGVTYGIIAPFSLGVTQVHYSGMYNIDQWFQILEGEKVSTWYTAPTALRMIRQDYDQLNRQYDISHLKHIFSVGEPLNREVIHWGRDKLKRDIYDTWFQTETGSIMISNRPGLEIRAGSMGKAVNGISAAILGDDDSPIPPGGHGNLCLKPGWKSMFVTYTKNQPAYEEKFRSGWYHTGDMAYVDRDGYFWFQGRSDDIINTAGHLVSPFEIESCLLELTEVGESAAIGAPDEMLYEKVVVFIRLREGVLWNKNIELKIRFHIANRVSSIATPREIRVVSFIPKNKSGKIMRRVLKAWYLNRDAGDISTMENE